MPSQYVDALSAVDALAVIRAEVRSPRTVSALASSLRLWSPRSLFPGCGLHVAHWRSPGSPIPSDPRLHRYRCTDTAPSSPPTLIDPRP